MAKGLERRGGGVCGSSGIAIMLVVVGILLPLRAVALPEAPAIWREVIGVDLKPGDPTKRVFTHPHLIFAHKYPCWTP